MRGILTIYQCPSDVINIRFFVYVVQQENPAKILQKVLEMLKPGGWLQWTEQDLTTARVISASDRENTHWTQQLYNFGRAPNAQFPYE